MTSFVPTARPLAAVLGEAVLPSGLRSWAREATLVVGSVLLLAALSQVVVPLPFTPVPLSLSTLGVVLVGASLGPARAIASTGLYLAVGVVGAPVFGGFGSGWEFASFGYILGYVPAAAVVGWGARRAADRRVGSMLLAAVVASLVIYAVGVTWLTVWLGVGVSEGLTMGMWPFLPGDAIKVAAAAMLLPGAWRLVERGRD